MQVRVHQIARLVFQRDDFSNDDIISEESLPTNNLTYNSIKSTLEAIKYILKMYRDEIKQFDALDTFEFSTMADIIMTIHRILNLDDLQPLIR